MQEVTHADTIRPGNAPRPEAQRGNVNARPGDLTGIQRAKDIGRQGVKETHAAAIRNTEDALHSEPIEIVDLPGGGGQFALPVMLVRYLRGDLTKNRVINRSSNEPPTGWTAQHARFPETAGDVVYGHPSDPDFQVIELDS